MAGLALAAAAAGFAPQSGCAPSGRVVDQMEKYQWAAVSAQTNAANAARTNQAARTGAMEETK